MRRSFKPGTHVVVLLGSGLDSGRVGTIIYPPWSPDSPRWKANEPGRYKPFNAKREVAIREDATNKVFTMFKSYLQMEA
jgi:hypothetical protein